MPEIPYKPEDYLHLLKIAAKSCAKNSPYFLDKEDLASMGFVGLLEACNTYDAEKATVKFEVYAKLRIKQRILDEIRSLSWAPRLAVKEAKVAPGEYEGLPGIGNFTDVLTNPNTPRTAETHHVLESSHLGLCCDTDPEGKTDLEETFDHIMSGIPDKYIEWFRMYLLEEKSFKEVGEIVGLSESRVCQIFCDWKPYIKIRLSGIDIEAPNVFNRFAELRKPLRVVLRK
jgi:RNA polymerase sigma factor for flagellar operon FliA